MLWCWIDIQDHERFTAMVALKRITHLSCEALHSPEADARISTVRLSVGEEEWEEAWHKGRVMILEEAVSYTLKGEASGKRLMPLFELANSGEHVRLIPL
jgi:hypothetical protein